MNLQHEKRREWLIRNVVASVAMIVGFEIGSFPGATEWLLVIWLLIWWGLATVADLIAYKRHGGGSL